MNLVISVKVLSHPGHLDLRVFRMKLVASRNLFVIQIECCDIKFPPFSLEVTSAKTKDFITPTEHC